MSVTDKPALTSGEERRDEPVVVPPAPRAARGMRGRMPRASRFARAPQEGAPAIVSTAFTMVAIVCAWMLLQTLVLSGVSYDRSQILLYNKLRVGLAETTAPLGVGPCNLNDPASPPCAIPAGEPVAILAIPAISLNEIVVEGTASGDLLDGPGHLRNTVLPGQVGTSFLFGRRATYGAPFAHITDLEAGDVVDVTTAQGVKKLTVLDVRHDGDPVPPAPTAGTARVTLVTAESTGGFLSALTPTRTVYVDAQAADGFVGPGGLPTSVPGTEAAMAGDSGALPLLALFLALLVGVTVAVIVARQRWSAPLVWVIASPLVITLAWVSTDTAMRLLPNLI